MLMLYALACLLGIIFLLKFFYTVAKTMPQPDINYAVWMSLLYFEPFKIEIATLFGSLFITWVLIYIVEGFAE